MTGLPAIGFSPEHEDLRSWAKDFAGREIAPVAEAIDRTDEYPRELAKKMGECGLLGLGTPKEYGGLGLDLVSSVVVAEEIAKVSLSAALIIGVQNGLVAYPISEFGTEEQKARYLPGLAKGEIIGSYGLTEAGAGSDAANIRTRAEKASGGAFKIDGTKAWISQGLQADVVVLFTRTGSVADGAAGMTAFLVEKGAPGFKVGGKLEVVGVRGTGTAELIFDGCTVPASSMLGAAGDGFLIAMAVLNQGRIGAAAGALGVANAALEASISYSKKRMLFDRQLGRFESIRFLIADMATRLEAARLLTYRAAYLRDKGEEFVKEASMAKVFSTEMAVWLCERAIQIHGGIGLSKLLPLERYLRDAKVLDIVEGTSEVQRWILAREILQDERALRSVAIVGTGHSKFGKRTDVNVAELAFESIKEAIEDSGVEKKEVENVTLGSAGGWYEEPLPAVLVDEYAGFEDVGTMRVEAACASGSAAVRSAFLSVASGEAEVSMAVGVEKMTEVDTLTSVELMGRSGSYLWEFENYGMTFPAYYALYAVAHMDRYGTTEEDMARVAVKAHHYASMNPLAHLQKEITLEKAISSQVVSWPLKLYDACPITDGSAAVVLASEDAARRLTDTPIWIRGIGFSSDSANLSKRSGYVGLRATVDASRKAYAAAKVGPRDVDVATCHDCFTIAELMAYEDLGFCAKGEGASLVRDGQTEVGGRIPVNLDGGLKAKGHPIGATGVSMMVEISKQLRGEAGAGRQASIKNGVGLVHNVGGTGHYCYVTVLSRSR